MKITAQLALSQMKVNKKRTIAGIFAIALATSLITTVMCFVTSANKMLTDFLGSDYGEYGGAYSLMLAIPALLLGLLIAAMSITVISNIFSASANKRIQEFGILKCVGATGRQIRASVIYESLWLSLTAIPLGLIAGTILGYISVKFTGHFISDINDAAKEIIATVYKGNIIKNLIMDCQSYTKYRPNETTGGIFVSWRRKEELPTGA